MRKSVLRRFLYKLSWVGFFMWVLDRVVLQHCMHGARMGMGIGTGQLFCFLPSGVWLIGVAFTCKYSTYYRGT